MEKAFLPVPSVSILLKAELEDLPVLYNSALSYVPVPALLPYLPTQHLRYEKWPGKKKKGEKASLVLLELDTKLVRVSLQVVFICSFAQG